MKHICLIPARKGSKRFTNKNRAKLKEKLLIEIAVETAISSQKFTEIIVSTDDEILIEAISSLDVTILKRPENLAGDNIGLVDVIRTLIKESSYDKEDTICLMPLTNPLRNADDVKKAYELYENKKGMYGVVSLQEVDYPVSMMFKLNDDLAQNYLDLDWKEMRSTRKQDFASAYMWNDAFVIDSVGRWSDPRRKIFTNDMIPYVMPVERSVAIDYEYHLDIAKLFYKG